MDVSLLNRLYRLYNRGDNLETDPSSGNLEFGGDDWFWCTGQAEPIRMPAVTSDNPFPMPSDNVFPMPADEPIIAPEKSRRVVKKTRRIDW
jgi:hypothetical protein